MAGEGRNAGWSQVPVAALYERRKPASPGSFPGIGVGRAGSVRPVVALYERRKPASPGSFPGIGVGRAGSVPPAVIDRRYSGSFPGIGVGRGGSVRPAVTDRRYSGWLALLAVLCICTSSYAQDGQPLKLWHAYSGSEREALETALESIEAASGRPVQTLFVPFDVLPEKLRTAIPSGRGPDLFIFAHDRLGEWVAEDLIQPLSAPELQLQPKLLEAFQQGGQSWGLPLTYKGLFLYRNPNLLESAPRELSELSALRAKLPPDVYPLAYDTGSFFFHAPFFFACGGQIFADDRIAVFDPAGRRSFELVQRLQAERVVPEEVDSARVSQLFNAGKAALVLSGPWFASSITPEMQGSWEADPLFAFEGRAAGSLLSVEGVFLAQHSLRPEAARSLAASLLQAELVAARQQQAHQPSPLAGAQTLGTGIGAAQRSALEGGEVTPNRPEMGLVWEVTAGLLRELLNQKRPLDEALTSAERRLQVLQQPLPEEADPSLYLLVLSLLLLAGAGLLLQRASRPEFRERLARGRTAYLFSAPALLAMLLLTFLPFVLGAGVAFFSHRGGEFTFVGLANFSSILLSRDYPLSDPSSFYFTLVVTVVWTLLNVALHVTLGLLLALLLRPAWLRMRSLYRVILVLPWAIPSYITALTWKAMFNRQFGAVNAVLGWLGVDPVSWFARFGTSFAANVTTNTWLGFPFMMVVTLGALQAIPPEQEEVARLCGASFLQRLRWVILPHIKPVLLPAVVLGSIWTFNMFNVIYLVSGGEPSGSTEILISEAYKWAFRRQHRYGYAAAYALLILGVLLGYSWLNDRLQRKERA